MVLSLLAALSIEAVGLTAAVARALSDAGISVSYGWDGGVVVSEDAHTHTHA